MLRVVWDSDALGRPSTTASRSVLPAGTVCAATYCQTGTTPVSRVSSPTATSAPATLRRPERTDAGTSGGPDTRVAGARVRAATTREAARSVCEPSGASAAESRGRPRCTETTTSPAAASTAATAAAIGRRSTARMLSARGVRETWDGRRAPLFTTS